MPVTRVSATERSRRALLSLPHRGGFVCLKQHNDAPGDKRGVIGDEQSWAKTRSEFSRLKVRKNGYG